MGAEGPIAAMGPAWQAYFTVLSFCLGACVGSFLNVCICRIPLGRSVISPGSRCPRCEARIAWRDNVPLISFFLLRGRCRRCRGRISPRYVVVELITAVLFLFVWVKFSGVAVRLPGLAPDPNPAAVVPYWIMISGLLLGTFVDLEHMIIPDRVTWGGMAAGLALSAAAPSLHHADGPLGGLCAAAAGAALGFGLLWTVAGLGKLIFRKDAMGFGDVKLLGAIGAFLGWRATLFTLMGSSMAGSIVGLSLVLSGRGRMQSRIPYGPYLALAAVVWTLWGADWWRAYTRWLLGAP